MILIHIALRNLLTHKVKSAIVGGLLIFAAFLIVVGLSLISSIDSSMSKSIVNSVAGHMQLQQQGAKDELSIFGQMGSNEVGYIHNFAAIRQALEAMPEVAAVVPMGIDASIVFGGNVLDVKLEALRNAVKAGDKVQIDVVRRHVRRMVALLDDELKNLKSFADQSKMSDDMKQGLIDVAEANQAKFWETWDADPYAHLEFLENKIAKMAIGEDMLMLRYVGTDTERFRKVFDRFEMVDGTPIPAGQRGFLFNKFTYEEQVKHKTARRLDKIKDRLAEGVKIATDDEIKLWVKLNRTQYKEITYQLDDVATEEVKAALQAELKSTQTDMQKLVDAFMDVNDDNFQRRYDLFYKVIAPKIRLYAIRPGDTMTINGFSQSGYATTVNVKMYGTFRFHGLDRSTMAGAFNILDLMTYRDLLGYMTADKKAEIAQLQAESGVKELKRENAEAELFGEGAGEQVEDTTATTPTQAAAVMPNDTATPTDAPVNATPTAVAAGGSGGAKQFAKALESHVYSQEELDSGVIRSAAIMLKDGVNLKDAMVKVNGIVEKDKLGVKALDWRTASGLVGNLITVIYVVLAFSIFIIFLVSLVIINNSLVMSTLERTREIGTMRAIGAQRYEILWMFVVEAVVMALVFGAIGCAIGFSLIAYYGHFGMLAPNDFMVFLAAGPRFYPALPPWGLPAAMIAVMIVTLISTLYPAWLAMRITPLAAMQDSE
jgi:ABC-type lipoprotein release transport system permease subunit